MNILISSYAFFPSIGGIEESSKLLADEFTKQGHNVKIVTQTNSAGQEELGPSFEIIRRPRALQLLRLVRWCDIFFHNNICLRFAWPLLFIRRYWVITHQSWISRPGGPLIWKDHLKLFVAKAATCISVSNAVKRHVRIPSTIIPNPYDNELFRELPDLLRDKDLIFLGRLVPDKGVTILLRSLKVIKQNGYFPELTIIGKGPENGKLQELVRNLGINDQVSFVGAKQGKELVRLLNTHKILVIPSVKNESFGIVSLEGIACGCIPVGSDNGGLKESIGPCGITFPAGDIHTLSRQIIRILSGDDTPVKYKEIRERHLSLHRKDRIAKAYTEIFENILRNKRPHIAVSHNIKNPVQSCRYGTSKKILLSHPTGNSNVRNALIGLRRENLLRVFCTSINWNDKSWINKFIPSQLQVRLKKRSFPESVRCLTKTNIWRESVRLFARELNLSRFIAGKQGPFSLASVYRSLDTRVSKYMSSQKELSCVYAYEDTAFYTFHKAHQLGIKCIYELPAGYFYPRYRIYKEEIMLKPEWASTITCDFDNKEKLAKKEDELNLADLIIVPSSFSKKMLENINCSQKTVKTVPYGAPLPPYKTRVKPVEKKLRVLFVGALTQQKGLSYLVDAVSSLRGLVELTLIGQKPLTRCPILEKVLEELRWIPSLPHHLLIKEMRRHDTLVLPSLSEGFGLVILEAMAQGLPVITTVNTGASDFIKDGEDGFIVPIRSSHTIQEKLERLASTSDLCINMGLRAQCKAQAYTWDNYYSLLVESIRTIL